MREILQRFISRKFLLAVVGILVAWRVQLSPEQIGAITALIISFTAAEGAADYQRAKSE